MTNREDRSPAKQDTARDGGRLSGGITRRPDHIPPHLSFGQERLWFLHQLEPDSPAYNRPLALRLQGPLQVEAVGRSIHRIVERHEALRMTVVTEAGKPVPRIAAALTVPLPVHDLAAFPREKRIDHVHRLARKEAWRPFRLEEGPLMRAQLFRLDADDHVLLLVFHHLVFDAWSAAIFQKEFCALYTMITAGEEQPLPALDISYADVAYWQRETASQERIAEGLSYWLSRLEGQSLTMPLPLDHPRPEVQTFAGASKRFSLSAGLVDRLKQLGREENATLFMVLLAAFHVLLQRYTGQQDTVVGVPTAGRMQSKTETLIGLFINPLVFRADGSGSTTVRECIRQTRRMVLEGLSHQDVPFEKVVEALNPERDLSLPPVFQLMFNFETFQPVHCAAGGVRIEPFDFDTGIAQYDLSMELDDHGDELTCTLVYNTDLFEGETAGRMLTHYHNLLSAFAAFPDANIGSLTMVSQEERAGLLAMSRGREADYRSRGCVHEMIERQVQETPEAVAVRLGDSVWTYRELNAYANQIATWLVEHELPREGLVGVFVDRSARMIACMLAVQKAGGAYVPLSPVYPRERLKTMFQDAAMHTVIVDEGTRPLLPEIGGLILDLDADAPEMEKLARTNLSLEVSPEQLAYVMFTSGSTGRPKGTLVEHRQVANILCSLLEEPGLAKEDIFFSVSPAIFDISIVDFYLPLMAGAQIVMVDRETSRDGLRLKEALEQAHPTVAFATPATWRMLLSAGWEGDGELVIFSGGEVLDRSLAEALLSRGGALWNMYGPTETTILSVIHPVSQGEGPVPIGRPVANTRVYIVDASMKLVPQGVQGELLIAGDGVSRGYCRRSSLTEERFIDDPFSDREGSRIFRTGDLGRWRNDGNIDFLGRLDEQVKVRGYRIELGDIEFHLGQFPGVNAAAMTTSPDPTGEQRIIAHVVVEEGHRMSPEAMRTFLRERIPDYMLPSVYVQCDHLPLTSSGKLDRAALAKTSPVPISPEAQPVLPRSGLEEGLAAIWTEVLKIDTVGIHTNFFDLGGHSLLATQIVARIRDVYHVDVAVRELFGPSATIAGLAEHIAALQWLAEQQVNASFMTDTDREQGEL